VTALVGADSKLSRSVSTARRGRCAPSRACCPDQGRLGIPCASAPSFRFHGPPLALRPRVACLRPCNKPARALRALQRGGSRGQRAPPIRREPREDASLGELQRAVLVGADHESDHLSLACLLAEPSPERCQHVLGGMAVLEAGKDYRLLGRTYFRRHLRIISGRSRRCTRSHGDHSGVERSCRLPRAGRHGWTGPAFGNVTRRAAGIMETDRRTDDGDNPRGLVGELEHLFRIELRRAERQKKARRGAEPSGRRPARLET
jgi:hypothetical protein